MVIVLPPSRSPAPEVTAFFQPVEAAFGEKESLNILLLGVDYNYDAKAQRYTSGARSDTILILRVEPLGKHLSMMSIPRDLLVSIGESGEYGYERINAAFSYGGAALTMQTVEKLTGMRLDHYVVVKSDVVADLVDTIGGVPIKVEKQMDWDDNWANLHIHLKPGDQKLNGNQAVGYCRFRQDEEGDFGRIQRQQKFLGALLAELKQKKHLQKYPELARVVKKKLKTDLRTEQLIGLATLYRSFPLDNIRKGRPQVEDYYLNGAACLVMAPGEPKATIEEVFRPLPNAKLTEFKVTLIADEKHMEEARRVSRIMKDEGFSSVLIRKEKEAESANGSTLTLRSHQGAGAEALRKMFPQLTLQKKEMKGGRPEVTLHIRSSIYVSEAV